MSTPAEVGRSQQRHSPVSAGVICGIAAINCLALVDVWTRRQPDEQILHGVFEEDDARGARLVLDEINRSDGLPTVHIDRSGALYVPPGQTAGIQVADGHTYRFWSEDPDLTPFCVFGLAERTGAAHGSSDAARGFADGRVLDIQGGSLHLVPWEVGAPLQVDEARLRATRRFCNPELAPTPLVVKVEGASVDATFGRCSVVFQSNTVATAVVVAGTGRATVEKDTRFETHTFVDWRVLKMPVVLSVLAAVGLSAGFGARAAVLTAVALAALRAIVPEGVPSFAFDLGAVLSLAIAALGGWARAALRLQAFGRHRGLLVAMPGAIFASVVSVAVVLPRDGGIETNRYSDTVATEPRCLLLQYSTVTKTTLRDPREGLWNQLAQGCAACGGGVFMYGQEGRTFPIIERYLCRADTPVRAGGNAVFVGGFTDDTLWSINDDDRGWDSSQTRRDGLLRNLWPALSVSTRTNLVSDLVRNPRSAAGLLNLLGEPTSQQLAGVHRTLAHAALKGFERQLFDLKDGLGCTRSHGLTFEYFQDFAWTDLRSDLGPERLEMQRRRREAIEGAGGTFVSLRDELRDQVGVAWFNDMNNLSAIGHRRVSQLICSHLHQERPERRTH